MALTGGSVINLSTLVLPLSPRIKHCAYTQAEVEEKRMTGYETQLPSSVFVQQSVATGHSGPSVDPDFLWLCSNGKMHNCYMYMYHTPWVHVQYMYMYVGDYQCM